MWHIRKKNVVYAFVKLSAKSHSFNILCTMDGHSRPTNRSMIGLGPDQMPEQVFTLIFGDLGHMLLDHMLLDHKLIWSDTLKSDLFQEYYVSAHCSRSMFADAPGVLCISNMVLEHIDLEYFSRLLKVQDHIVPENMVLHYMVLHHKSRPKSHKSIHFEGKLRHPAKLLLIHCVLSSLSEPAL